MASNQTTQTGKLAGARSARKRRGIRARNRFERQVRSQRARFERQVRSQRARFEHDGRGQRSTDKRSAAITERVEELVSAAHGLIR